MVLGAQKKLGSSSSFLSDKGERNCVVIDFGIGRGNSILVGVAGSGFNVEDLHKLVYLFSNKKKLPFIISKSRLIVSIVFHVVCMIQWTSATIHVNKKKDQPCLV